MRCGQAVTPLRPSDRARIDQLGDGATICATSGGKLVALAEIDGGRHPSGARDEPLDDKEKPMSIALARKQELIKEYAA